MKKLLAIFILLMQVAVTIAQHSRQDDDDSRAYNSHRNRLRNCDTQVQKLDSITSFSYNLASDEFVAVNRTYFYYDSEMNHTASLTIKLPERSNISYQTYKWDENGNWTEYLYQEWKGDSWVDIRLWKYYYDVNNKIQSETHASKDATGNWIVYERHFYNYEDGILVNYLRQSVNQAGEWYDVAKHYYTYNPSGQLVNLYGEYIASGIVFWDRTSYYNEFGQLSERYLKVLKYNSILKQNELVNSVHNIYTYDIYGDVAEVLNESWKDNLWQVTSKAVYHYSLIPNKKVSICHNGQSLCISTNAVKAHLAHGDKLGNCENLKDDKGEYERQHKRDTKESNYQTVSLYPNPATNMITISLPEKGGKETKGYIITSGGRVIKSLDFNGRDQLTIDVSSYQRGVYLMKLTSKKGVESISFVKN